MVKKLFKVIKEIESENETEVISYGLIQREDHDFRDLMEAKGYKFIENSKQA